jgi:hypothetical protein
MDRVPLPAGLNPQVFELPGFVILSTITHRKPNTRSQYLYLLPSSGKKLRRNLLSWKG